MPITEKVKRVVSISGKTTNEVAGKMGIAAQSLYNKYSRKSFSAEDLVKIADATGSSLCFIFPDGVKVPITLDDVSK